MTHIVNLNQNYAFIFHLTLCRHDLSRELDKRIDFVFHRFAFIFTFILHLQ